MKTILSYFYKIISPNIISIIFIKFFSLHADSTYIFYFDFVFFLNHLSIILRILFLIFKKTNL